MLCYKCASKKLQGLAFLYRADIPKADLPGNRNFKPNIYPKKVAQFCVQIEGQVTRRPDCYWGKNCRTQKTNANHAEFDISYEFISFDVILSFHVEGGSTMSVTRRGEVKWIASLYRFFFNLDPSCEDAILDFDFKRNEFHDRDQKQHLIPGV